MCLYILNSNLFIFVKLIYSNIKKFSCNQNHKEKFRSLHFFKNFVHHTVHKSRYKLRSQNWVYEIPMYYILTRCRKTPSIFRFQNSTKVNFSWLSESRHENKFVGGLFWIVLHYSKREHIMFICFLFEIVHNINKYSK